MFHQRKALSLCLAALLIMLVPIILTRGEGQAAPSADAPSDTLVRFIDRLHLARPRHQGPVTIVPVVGQNGGLNGGLNVKTLSEALRDNSLLIHEIGEGRVNELEVENSGKIPVFIMAGQILVGAKQNRVLQHDLLLPPQSGLVTVEAFCVQQHRWSYTGDKSFSHGDNVSNVEVRQAKAQSEVWSKVAKTRASVFAGVGAATPSAAADTADLNEVYEKREVRRKIDGYESAFRDLPQSVPDMQGAVVLLDGRVVAVDVFGDRAVLRRLWRPLLASYVLEGVRHDRGDIGGSTDSARDFLRRATESEVRRLATPGGGVLVELVGGSVSGDALLTSRTVMHAAFFPRGRVTPQTDYQNEPPIQRPR